MHMSVLCKAFMVMLKSVTCSFSKYLANCGNYETLCVFSYILKGKNFVNEIETAIK